jgi:hypothetical protein
MAAIARPLRTISPPGRFIPLTAQPHRLAPLQL